MTFNIFRVIWVLIHVIYSFMHHLAFAYITIRRKFEELLSKESAKDELEFIIHNVKLLVKVPGHLVVILGNEQVSFSDLANLTVWCLAAGISFVSFYDHNGILKKNESKLMKALSILNPEHVKNIIWGKNFETNGHATKNGTNGHVTKNGIHGTSVKNGMNGINGYGSPKLTVNVFTLGDGRGCLVDVANGLCRSDVDDVSAISPNVVDGLLQKSLGIPEPELAVYCGTTCSTYGLLPWHIRYTEFLELQSHHNLKVKDFITLLNKYGSCQQRFGK